jgi:hypothetical protein
MIRCPRCALPDTFPGFEMTAADMCSYRVSPSCTASARL